MGLGQVAQGPFEKVATEDWGWETGIKLNKQKPQPLLTF